MASDTGRLARTQPSRIPLFMERSSRLRGSKGDSFVRDLLGPDVVIYKGFRSRRAIRHTWGFYYQSEDPLTSPTVSEVDAAEGMLILAGPASHDGFSFPGLSRTGSRSSVKSGPHGSKRPRFAVEEEDETTVRTVLTDQASSDEAAAPASAEKQAPQVGTGSISPGVSTSANSTNQVISFLAAFQGLQPNAVKGSNQLGLPIPLPIRPPDPPSRTLQLPTSSAVLPVPPLFTTSASSNSVPNASGALPLMLGVLNAPNKAPPNPATVAPAPTPPPVNLGGMPPVLMFPSLGPLSPAAHHSAIRPELKGELERLIGQGGPLLPLPVAPVLFPNSASSAPTVPQIPLPRGVPLQSLPSQVPLPALNVPFHVNPNVPSPRSVKDLQTPRNGGLDPSQAAQIASLTQLLAVFAGLKQGS